MENFSKIRKVIQHELRLTALVDFDDVPDPLVPHLKFGGWSSRLFWESLREKVFQNFLVIPPYHTHPLTHLLLQEG